MTPDGAIAWIVAALTAIRGDNEDALHALYEELEDDEPLLMVSALLGMLVEVTDEETVRIMGLRVQSRLIRKGIA